MINGLHGNTYEEKLRELGLQSLKERRAEADLILAYKMVHGLISVNSDSWPKLQNELGRDLPHRTRSAADELKLRQPFARSDKRKNFFTVRVCEAWNKLPLSIRRSKNIGQFKKSLRIFAASSSSEAMDN
jgi:hypothetical protein